MTDSHPSLPDKAHSCTHPPGLLKLSQKLTPEAIDQYAEVVRRCAVDGVAPVIVGDPDAEWVVIECSWCENPEAVARRHAAFTPRPRWWQVWK